jgi:hypothetical protein
MSQVSLIAQVWQRLRKGHGGTGNIYGWAENRLHVTGSIDTADESTVVRGRCVVARNGGTGDRRVWLPTATDHVGVLGIVTGRAYTTGDYVGEWEDADPAYGQMAYICTSGYCKATLGLASSKGQYLYAYGSAGKVYSSAMLRPGAFGLVMQDGAADASVLVHVGLPFLGRQREAYVSRYEPAPHDAFRFQITSASNGSDHAEAVDGDPTSSWTPGTGATPQNLVVDLSVAQPIREVRVRWGAQYGTAYTIDSSSDGSSWTTRATITSNTRRDRASDLGSIITARYWRINYTAISGGTPTIIAFEGYPSTPGLDHSALDAMRFAIPVQIGSRAAVPSTGYKGEIEIPVPCVFEGWRLVSDQTCTAVIDIWRDTYANFPPTVADTITASAKPTLTAARKAQDSALAGWADECAAGDWLAFNLDSDDVATQLKLSLAMRRI